MAPEPIVPTRSSSLGGAAACVSTVLIWSGNTIVTKAAAGLIAPGSIAFYRWLMALLILLPIIGPSAWRNREAALARWKHLMLLGLLGMVVCQSLAYEAAETTSAVNMGVILALMPLFSTLLACVFGSERLTGRRIAGGIVSFAGLVYLTSHGDPLSLAKNGVHVGDLMMLVAVLSNSLYGVMIKRWSIPITLWQQLFWQILFSTALLLPIWMIGPVSPVTLANLPLIMYAAIPASLIAPMCWMYGIQQLGSGRTSLFVNLLPIVVALLAWSVLHEQLRSYHFVGGAVALFGVVLGLREERVLMGSDGVSRARALSEARANG